MNKRTIFIVGGIIAFLFFCCLLLAATGFGIFFISKNVISQNEIQNLPIITLSATQVIPKYTLEPISTPEIGSESGANEPDDKMLSTMEIIEEQVEKLRGLSLSNQVSRKTLPQAELRQRVMQDFFADYTIEDSQKDALILDLFGFLEKDYDLYNLYLDLYSEQIAGFYDDETREMVVVQGEAFSGSEKMTYAHEFTHALQDEAFDLKNGLKLDEDYCLQDSEYCASVQALVEGDATLTETLWFLEHSTNQDKKDIFKMFDNYQSPIFDSAPPFLKEDFLFAYSQGLEFVQSLYDSGGFDAIDAAYLNPPLSTEQILHPNRYPDDVPVILNVPNFSGMLDDGWVEIDRNNLGEWYTYLLLAKAFDPSFRINDEQAKDSAEGWGGDQYVVYHNPDTNQEILVYRSDWDTQKEADEFWSQFTKYGISRWGKEQKSGNNLYQWKLDDKIVTISMQSNQILWVIAPDNDISKKILSLFPDFPLE